MHERFKAGDLDLQYEVSSRMAADIYTKAFSDGDKWQAACWLINIVDPKIIQSAIKYVTYEEPDLGKVVPEDYFDDSDMALAAIDESAGSPPGETGHQGTKGIVLAFRKLIQDCNKYIKANTIKDDPSPPGDRC